jgi:hypothetical protein
MAIKKIGDHLQANTHRTDDAISWDDLRFPLTGQNLDSAATRYQRDLFNGGVSFDANSRFPNEAIVMTAQLPHKWREESTLKPHFHWLQQHATEIPNWMLAYKLFKKNTSSFALESDFSNFTQVAFNGHAFTFGTTVFTQITMFPDIDMTGYGFSDTIVFALFRDTTNASGLFAGADPSALVEIVQEFDIHFEIDSEGSTLEFTK